MKRGEIWTVAAGSGYGGKPRPAVIIQDDKFDATNSVTICMITSQIVQAEHVRPVVVAAPGNGLRTDSALMVDKIITVPRAKAGAKTGALSQADMGRLEQAMLVLLGLAG